MSAVSFPKTPPGWRYVVNARTGERTPWGIENEAGYRIVRSIYGEDERRYIVYAPPTHLHPARRLLPGCYTSAGDAIAAVSQHVSGGSS